ncbi:MAG: NUDIX domain-containing protein [Candidatus Hadarchaeum sp.]|uniref:NUDIX domain-containing protein n=1 Tax=Candidatus Hadarchaeum sp. TaxID=2883567 RepID=UPI003D0A59F6
MTGPALTVDVVIKFRGGVVLVRRKNEPFKDKWALPGGFVEYGERVEAAAVREAWEETGLRVKLLRLLGVYSDPDRDPRGHTVSICFLAKRAGGRLRSGSDAKDVGVFRKIPWEELAFDHAQILKDAGFK